jgi:RHS repeat-associated protein
MGDIGPCRDNTAGSQTTATSDSYASAVGYTFTASYTNNRRNGFTYDLAGNMTSDPSQTMTYDATGQQVTDNYSGYALTQGYDGDTLRVKKTENGVSTYYLRSSVLGGQVVVELNWFSVAWGWARGYVYSSSGQLIAVQQDSQVRWVHEDPVTKTKRMTDSSGAVISTIVFDPWGGAMGSPWSQNTGQQRKRFTTYERDGNEHDEAMFRRYNHWMPGFIHPDPYDGSYNLSNPQSFNRYPYAQNDPVSFIDPTGLDICYDSRGNTYQCAPEDARWQRENPEVVTNAIATNTSAPRVGDYMLPAWLSGHSPTVISILDTPVQNPFYPENPNPQDGDVAAVNGALGACSIGASIAQYSTVNPSGTMWKGRNGQWNRMGWPGNQHTGGRSVALSNANSFKLLGRATFTVGAVFSGAQAVGQLQQGNNAGAAKSGLDITMSAVGTFGGPKGLAVSGIYFGIDTFVGWQNCAAFLTAPCDRECRRK